MFTLVVVDVVEGRRGLSAFPRRPPCFQSQKPFTLERVIDIITPENPAKCAH